MIQFYTKEGIYVVTETQLFKNGECLVEGKIKVHQLLLDEPAWFLVDRGESYPSTFIKIPDVYSVNPKDEYFEGQPCPKRETYHVTFNSFVNRTWIRRERVITAVNSIHCRQIIKRQFGKEVRVININQIEKAIA